MFFVFQLTPPIQRATNIVEQSLALIIYFNSRPLYRGRQEDIDRGYVDKRISTHAPYTEGDVINGVMGNKEYISTHAPYTEGDCPTVIRGAY
ncbi:hypothetical protein LRB_1584 [Ligilactobacillus ruminis]|uniref:Uncharacterized protein n=1 Tax=Ligilactobacillus ruminis TaxID=1623 RepID=A0A837IND2_9LACO|nr:hypothetical protein LRB_1584 [Ligilactobacillus ruminis]